MTTEHSRSLVEVLGRRAETDGDTNGYTFLVDGEREGQRLSYGQLDTRSREIAVMLQRRLLVGDRALLLYPPGLDFVSAFFGCLYAGVIAVPSYPPHLVRPPHGLPRLRAIAREAGVAAILCTRDIAVGLRGLFGDREPLILNTDLYGGQDAAEWQRHRWAPDAIAFLQYTSGSTAAPKGVMISHANIWHNLRSICRGAKLDRRPLVVSWLPTYHDMGLFLGVLLPVFTGCSSYLMPPVSFLQRPVRWLQAISRYRGTFSGGPDFSYDLCVRRSTAEQRRILDLRSWKIAFNGAEPVRRRTLDRFCRTFGPCGFRSAAFHPVYGLAEATVFVSGCSLQEADAAVADGRSSSSAGSGPLAAGGESADVVSCGPSYLDTELIIVDPQTKRQIAHGTVGEIWVRGPSVARGYWKRPADSAEAFQARLSDSGEGPFLRTGDLGFLRGGQLFVTGRIKDVIIIRGRKLYPQDIEQTVELCHPLVRPNATAAVGLPGEQEERVGIVAEVNWQRPPDPARAVESTERRAELDEVMGAIRQAVAEQHQVQTCAISLLPRGRIPKTTSGKIQRQACRRHLLDEPRRSLARWSLPDGGSRRQAGICAAVRRR